MKNLLTALAIVSLVAGCATGVVPMDKGTFMTSKTSTGGAFGNPQSLLAELYEEANQYCAKSSQSVETINANPENGIPFVRPARASLQFRCVDK